MKRHWCYTSTCPAGQHKVGCYCRRNKVSYYAGCERLCVEKPEIKPGGKEPPRGAMVCGDQSRQNYPVVADGQVEHILDPTKEIDYKQWFLDGIPFTGDAAGNVNMIYKGVFTNENGQLILDSNNNDYAKGRNYIVALESEGQVVYYTWEGNHNCQVYAKQDYDSLTRVYVLEKTH